LYTPYARGRANAIVPWLVVETLLAANAAEEKSLPVVCGCISRPSGLNSHPTHGIDNRRVRTHGCRVRQHVGSRESGTGFASGLIATPELEDLGHDTETNFRGCHGAKLQSGRALDALQQLWLYALVV